MFYLTTFVIFSIFILIVTETLNSFNKESPLRIKPLNFRVNKSANNLEIDLNIEIFNTHKRMEVMIPELKIKPILLGNGSNEHIKISTFVNPQHPEIPCRKDRYWQAYILKSKHSTSLSAKIKLTEETEYNEINNLTNLWVEFTWVNYGPFGRSERKDGFNIPMSFPNNDSNARTKVYSTNKYKLIPIKTHILGVFDDPIEVLEKYTKDIYKAGDILTIGETPLAIMQGRYINPFNINITIFSKLICRLFHPTSSLATACGIQVLINEVGLWRVITSAFIASLFKLFGIKGFFYRLAGSQARLIDDITGTTPPYDQTIVLGPKNTNQFCKLASSRLGIDVAVVDVNDLGKVKVLASNTKIVTRSLYQALKSNPAGNADQHTPIVIVRPF